MASDQDETSTQDNTGRRRFLKRATLALGGAMGAVTAWPLVSYFLHPVGRKLVSAPNEPIDVGAVNDLEAGGAPVRLPIIANGVRDAWNTSNAVAIGSCWVRKAQDGTVTAFSSVCPHLGCAINFAEDSKDYRCPCHASAFDLEGKKKDAGPAKRGLDPLEVKVEDGRIKVVYQRFRNDIAEREPV